jgi:hypothetical protein
MRNKTKRTDKPSNLRSLVNLLLFAVALLIFTAGDMLAQYYEVTINQRRMGNKIGVEFWVRSLTTDAPNLGNASLSVIYDRDYMIPDGENAYNETDSVYYDMDVAAPFITITSPFSDATYGYQTLSAQPASGNNGGAEVYTHQLDVNLNVSGVGFKPASTGRGSFVGMVKFKITNYNNITDNTLTGVAFNPNTWISDISINDANGNDIESQVTFTDPDDFAVRGITILNPNGPNQAVNRYPEIALASLSPNKGYPIYFERSGLADSLSGSTPQYGTSRFAYNIEYSLDAGSSWAAIGRVAETTNDVLAMGTNTNLYFTGELDVPSSTNERYITQGDGTALPAVTGDGYEGVLRVIWAANENFSYRSEQAKVRVSQLDTATSTSAISSRTVYSSTGRRDISDFTFVLGRYFFIQFNGTDSYMKTKYNYSGATQLTVEAWVNLNSAAADDFEPAIVASSAGEASPEEGAWMLYIANGQYPTFRVREIEGRGPGGYIGTVQSPTALLISSDATPISFAHGDGWTHVAATVANGVVTMYVNGEIVDRYTNTQSVNPRILPTLHPIWIGVNPNLGIEAGDYLHAGIKEVKVWRYALSQEKLRSRIAGVYDPAGTISAISPLGEDDDERAALELYYPLQGARLDAASDFYHQNSANPINWYDSPSIDASADNTAINYRPDRSHITLTSPVGGEGVSNLEDETFPIRWAAYGLGKTSTNTDDLQIMVSRDNGTTWFDAIDSQTPALIMDNVEVEAYQALWEPYNNITLAGQDDDLQGLVPIDGNYSKEVILRIGGTEARNQDDIYDISGTFYVAPYFALANDGNARVEVTENMTSLNLSGATNYIEAWIAPYRFPDEDEGYFPIVTKKSSDAANTHYALRLLESGQLELEIGSTSGTVVARSAAGSPLVAPNVLEYDSVWYHVGAYVNLANGGTSSVRFYIDGTPQYVDSISTQLGTGVSINNQNTYPFYIGYEPTADGGQGFVGEIKEVRFWAGNPGGQAPSGTEPSALTKFIQGAATVRADELGVSGTTDYSSNLVCAFQLNGGSFSSSGFSPAVTAYPSTANIVGMIKGTGYEYSATMPYLKLIEPVYKQQVQNDETALLVRWTGFDYNRNNTTTFRNGNDGTNHADLEYSIAGGGGMIIQPYQYVASEVYSAGYVNALTLPTSNGSYEFQGTTAKSQFGAALNVSIADPDENNDNAYNDQGVIGATMTNARLRLKGRATLNGSTLEYDNGTNGNVPSLRTESAYFDITPPSNFTVRVLLEGYHISRVIQNNIGTSYAEGGMQISLYEDNANVPGNLVSTAQSLRGYDQSYTSSMNPNVSGAERGEDGSRYANVPYVFTEIADDEYFVKVDHINHLPIMSKYPVPFSFAGDDQDTWVIESGWDFQAWNGVANNTLTEADASTVPPTMSNKYSAYGNAATDPDLSEYAATGLIYNDGQAGVVTTDANNIAAMVGGDVVKDGVINAADRAKVVLYDGGVNISADVTGDGYVNATDRTITYRNSGKLSSLTSLPQVNMIEPYGESEIFAEAPDLSKRFIDAEREFYGRAGKTYHKENARVKILAGGLEYKVYAYPSLKDNYIEVPMYIENVGGEFAAGNCTFGITFDEVNLKFENMVRYEDVIFNNKPNTGYFETFSGPFKETIDPITDLRTIDIDYDIFSNEFKPGVNVPYNQTYLGTLRFKIENIVDEYAFNWHEITVVHTTTGEDVTGSGTFIPIQPVTVARSVQIITPNGGEEWNVGRMYTVSWSRPNFTKQVHLDFSTDNGASWERMTKAPIDISAMSYNWFTPEVNSTECLVRIVAFDTGKEFDRSNGTFSIKPEPVDITRPASTDPIYAGATKDLIKWTTDKAAMIYFEFSDNAGASWYPVTNTVSSTLGQVEWTVPSVNTKTAIIRMINAETNQEMAYSGQFKILAGQVTLTSPREGDKLSVGENRAIRWNYNNVSRFDLQFSPDMGQTWQLISRDVVAINSKHNWIVPNVKTDHGIIRALWNNDPDMEYSRTEGFLIDGSLAVKGDDEFSSAYEFNRPVPNPFTDQTEVSFTIPFSDRVTIAVFNSTGQEVLRLADGDFYGAGTHSLTLHAGTLPAGAYYIYFSAGTFSQAQEVILIK